MKKITTLKILKDKTVLLRADFNVPMKGSRITDPFRIVKTIPTIKLLRKLGAKIIIISHIGDDGSTSLKSVARELNKSLPVTFVPAVIGPKVDKAIALMKSRDVVLLENLRTEKGEKDNDPVFAETLASYADIYVNDAFSVCHREHASVVGVPKLLPHYAGLQLIDEVAHLSIALKRPPRPFLFILGGAKFATKLPVLKRYMKDANHIVVGGALANEVWQEEGLQVGTSLVDTEDFGLEHLESHTKVYLPEDVVVRRGAKHMTVGRNEVTKDEQIVDIGTQSCMYIAGLVKQSKLIVWNGPLGLYESGFSGSTKWLIELLAKSRAETIVGGGDTVALISKMKLEKKFSFVSTGGGAAIDFLAQGSLPGIEVLK